MSCFRGGKNTLYEGGVRVAAFIHGPKRYFPRSFDYDGLFHISDFYPTILDIISQGIILINLNTVHRYINGPEIFLIIS